MRATIVGVSMFFFGTSAWAEPPCTDSKAKHMLNFQGADLREAVEFFSVITCKKFILSEKVVGSRITLTSQAALSTSAAYEAFESSLSASGLALVPEGKFVKIIASNTGNPPSTAMPKSPARIELTFTEGKSSASYQLTTPDKNHPSRLELRGPEQEIYIEFVWLKDGSALQYDIKRTTFGKSGSAVVDLSGTIGLPATGKTSLISTPGLNLELGFAP